MVSPMGALIDTHKVYTDFTENGFEPKQAETLIRAVQSGQVVLHFWK
jgi:hypothetical protein